MMCRGLRVRNGSSAAKLKLAFGIDADAARNSRNFIMAMKSEWPGGGDPDNRRDFPGGWRGDPRNAFTEAGRTREQQGMFAYVQKLLRLRREHPALTGGRLWHFADEIVLRLSP